MAAAAIEYTNHLKAKTGNEELQYWRLWQNTTPGGSGVEGSFWYNSTSGDKRIYFYDGSADVKVLRGDRDEDLTGQWTFSPGSAQAPFVLDTNAQGQLVTGLNAEQLSGYEADQTVTANTVATRYTAGRLRVGDAVDLTDAVNIQYLNSALAFAAFDASQITTGQLALARGGTNADLSGVATGGLIYKGASALAATAALTGVLLGNGSSAPTAVTPLTITNGGVGATSYSGARTNLDVLWADDTRGLLEARSSRGGCYSDGASTKISGNPGFAYGLGDFTFSVVARLPDWTPTTAFDIITSHGSGNNRVKFVLATGGQFQIFFVDSGGTFTGYTLTPDVALVDGTTYRITVTVDRDGVATLYINSVSDRDKNGTSVTVSVSAASSVDIGSGNANNWGHVGTGAVGVFYELLAFNHCLTAAQVAELTSIGSVPFTYQWGTFTNLVSASTLNGGFETAGGGGADDFGSWTENEAGTSTVTRDTSEFQAGSASCRFDVDSSASACSVSQAVLTIGKQYRVRFYAKHNGTATGVSISTSTANAVTTAVTGSWVQYEVTLTADSTSLIVGRVSGETTRQFWVDNVEVLQIGCIQALDLENARPSLTTTIKDRSTNNNHGTATTGFNQIKAVRQANFENALVSGLTVNQVVYAGTGGLLTGLALNSGSIRVLTQASSGAPVWTDLFGGNNTWTGTNTFQSTVSITGMTTNTVHYTGSSGVVTGLGLNSTATVKFLTQVSSGAPTWTDLYAASPTWSGNHTFSGTVIVPTPSAANHAATMGYVDSVAASGLRPLVDGPCAVATTANITLSGEQTIDGVLTSGTRVLVKDQSTASENGPYISASGAWSRTTDCNTAAEISVGAYTFVTGGTVNAGTSWRQANTVTTLGTDPVTWVQFFQQADYTEGAGIDITGQTVSLDLTYSPTWSGTHTFSNAPLISTLNENEVLYSGAAGEVTGLGLNTSSTVKFLTQASSGAPTWTDLYNSTAAWTAAHTFTTSGGLSLNPHGASAGNTTELRFVELAAGGSHYVGFKAPDAISTNLIWTLPSADGSANYYLKTSGAGVLSFAQIASGEISNSSFVTSVSGTTSRITVSGTLTPTIDISSSYVGQSSIITVGTISTGGWEGTVIAGEFGGTGQSAYANGDMLYGANTNELNKLTIGAANRFLYSTGSAPAWSAYGLPTSVTQYGILYATSTTAVGVISPSANKILTSDGSGIPSFTATLPSGLTIVGDANSSPMKGRWFNVGDASSTSIALTHNYGTTDVIVRMYEVSTGREHGAVASVRTNNNVVTLEFLTAPTLNQYRAVVLAQI